MALRISAVRAAMAHVLDVAMGTEIQIATSPDQINPPCLYIGMPDVEYHQAHRRGLDSMELPIFGVLPRINDVGAVELADGWMSGTGPQSVLTILEADPTLGGACQALVTRRAVAEMFPTGGSEMPAIHWTIEVYG